MAILHKKEEKIQAVIGRLPKKYTDDAFVEMFIKLFSKDWGKIKSAYIKQSQDKEVGTVITMPKPADYLKQILNTFLQQSKTVEVAEKPVKADKKVAEQPEAEKAVLAKKAVAKKTKVTTETEEPKSKVEVEKSAPAKKAPAKKITKVNEEAEEVKKTKTTAKKASIKK
jgi:hypothetical protein